MPQARRKKWWEKLEENKHDDYYKVVQKLLKKDLTANLRQVYSQILERKQLPMILKL